MNTAAVPPPSTSLRFARHIAGMAILALSFASQAHAADYATCILDKMPGVTKFLD